MKPGRPGRADWGSALLLLVLAGAVAGVCQGGPFPPADRLLAMQEADGRWEDWAGMEWYTGYIIPGLVRCYDMSGYAPYKESAEKAGQWVLDNVGWQYLFGEEAYAMQRLSEIAPDPTSNQWREAITGFYLMVSGYPNGGTAGYIAEQILDVQDPSIAAISIAHHVSAAYYLAASDRAIWRAQLINALAGVTDDTAYYPVTALGASLWALALTGELDNTPIPGASGSVWDGKTLADLPGMLVAHQEPTTGGFYWRFDHDTEPGYPAYGHTESTVFGTLGLMASANYGSYDVAIAKGIYAVLRGFKDDGSMWDHLWDHSYNGALATHLFAGEALRLMIPEPTSAALLGACLAGLAWRSRRRRTIGRTTTDRA